MKKRNLTKISILWILLISSSFLWNYYIIKKTTWEIVENKAESFFSQILVARMWNSSHGGIYVPVTEKTKPNPYLKDSLRDLETTNGIKLTKINPAYMTRQIAEINKSENDLQFHITSLNPIRPANKADEWESKSLRLFENRKNKKKIDLLSTDSISVYRYIAPLVTEKSCLKCHEAQGYKIGDIRGGISVTFPSKIYLTTQNKQLFYLSFAHLLILFVGIFGILRYYKMINNFIVIVKDKNNQLELESNILQKTNKKLLISNATKDKFFSIIAHDLKSPFNSIIGFSEVLIEQVKNADYKGVRKYADIINQSSYRAMNLLMNLMEWAQSQTGRMEFNPESFIINDIINENCSLFDEIATQKSITIKTELPDKYTVTADKAMISTILRNLISNAIKFTKQDGQLCISAKLSQNKVIVSVRDTGVGIPPESIEKLFRIDETYSTYGTNKESGTGLGLILCKEFIDKHAEKIWVESELTIGTCFYFTLPSNTENEEKTTLLN